jgi:serine/threonine protein kinase
MNIHRHHMRNPSPLTEPKSFDLRTRSNLFDRADVAACRADLCVVCAAVATAGVAQVLQSLAFLHSLGLVHSDLKPENILIKSYSRYACLVPQQLTTGLSWRCALDILHPRISQKRPPPPPPLSAACKF